MHLKSFSDANQKLKDIIVHNMAEMESENIEELYVGEFFGGMYHGYGKIWY